MRAHSLRLDRRCHKGCPVTNANTDAEVIGWNVFLLFLE